MEGDRKYSSKSQSQLIFQSTPSAWRETAGFVDLFQPFLISIHSLRMEGDDALSGWQHSCAALQSTPSAWRETRTTSSQHFWNTYFNPLPPHGGRPTSTAIIRQSRAKFQSTPSAWRETLRQLQCCKRKNIFQSTPSAWRETVGTSRSAAKKSFQSTPSAWRET